MRHSCLPLLIVAALHVGCVEYHMQRVSDDEEVDWFDGVQDRRPGGADEAPGTAEDESDDGENESDPPDTDEDDGSDDRDDSDDDGDDWTDDGDDGDDGDDDWDDDWDDDDWDDDSDPCEPGPGESRDSAWAPWTGDMVFTELMIDPDAVHDRLGEWVEIRNTSGYWVDLTGHRLGDDDLDDVEIEATSSGSLVVAPGGDLVICGEADYWDNGGVECDGTFRYWTFGDGFAMSNTEDEARLISPDGITLDRVAWGAEFAEVGAAMGLEASAITVGANDALDRWCDQWSYLPFGDAGTPGEANDSCW